MDTLVFQSEPLEDFYELQEELGRGNFAIVKRCRKKESDEEYAAKCITKKRSKASKRGMSKEAVEIEAGILLALDHEAIIKLYDVFETKLNITLIMELLTGGELFEEIAKEEFILEKDACRYTKQVLNAIQHMHDRNIVHLDLKPENIVLQYPGSKTIKLIDFGLAKIVQPGKEIREMMGTPEFAAPEVINYDIVGFYTDMWAIGVVTYILLSGASPFLGDDDPETYKNITSCDYQFDDEYFEKITKNAKDFIEKLLVKNPKDRNTVQDCLNHPWIAFEESENSVIDTQKMRAFVARRRWKQSLKLVATISRLKMLCRNSIPSPTSDASGDEGDSSSENGGVKPSFLNLIKATNEKLPEFTNRLSSTASPVVSEAVSNVAKEHAIDDHLDGNEQDLARPSEQKESQQDEQGVTSAGLEKADSEMTEEPQLQGDNPGQDGTLIAKDINGLSINEVKTDATEGCQKLSFGEPSGITPVLVESSTAKRYVGEAVTIRGNFGEGSAASSCTGLVTFSIPFGDGDELKDTRSDEEAGDVPGGLSSSEDEATRGNVHENSPTRTGVLPSDASPGRRAKNPSMMTFGAPVTINLGRDCFDEQAPPPQSGVKGLSFPMSLQGPKNDVVLEEERLCDNEGASKFTVTIPNAVDVCNKGEELTFTLKRDSEATPDELVTRMDPVKLKVGLSSGGRVAMKGITTTNEGDLVVIELAKPDNNNG